MTKKLLYIFYLAFFIPYFYSCNRPVLFDKNQIANSSEIIAEEEVETLDIYQVNASKITYTVDSLKISGYIVRPKIINQALPVIIYNRGGNRDFGKISVYQFSNLCYLAKHGYVVLASQYRGNTLSEGKDELGGDDLNDVLALIDIAEQLPYANEDKIGVLGYSRGGLMAYLASKATDKIDAIVVVGAPTDLFLSIKNRPNMYTHVMLPLIGDTLNRKDEYIKRSPIHWSDHVNEPTLILHGTKDERVNVLHAKRMIAQMEKNHQTIQYKLFEDGNHSLTNIDETEVDNYIFDWFKLHLSN